MRAFPWSPSLRSYFPGGSGGRSSTVRNGITSPRTNFCLIAGSAFMMAPATSGSDVFTIKIPQKPRFASNAWPANISLPALQIRKMLALNPAFLHRQVLQAEVFAYRLQAEQELVNGNRLRQRGNRNEHQEHQQATHTGRNATPGPLVPFSKLLSLPPRPLGLNGRPGWTRTSDHLLRRERRRLRTVPEDAVGTQF